MLFLKCIHSKVYGIFLSWYRIKGYGGKGIDIRITFKLSSKEMPLNDRSFFHIRIYLNFWQIKEVIFDTCNSKFKWNLYFFRHFILLWTLATLAYILLFVNNYQPDYTENCKIIYLIFLLNISNHPLLSTIQILISFLKEFVIFNLLL